MDDVGEQPTARMDERGLVELDDSVPKSSRIEDGRATLDAKDLTPRKINAELRWLIYEQGMRTSPCSTRAPAIRSGSRSSPAAGSASRAASATSAAA